MNKRGVARFSVESFSLTVPRSFVGEPFSVSLIWDIENVWIRGGGGGVSSVSVESFCLTVPKIS